MHWVGKSTTTRVYYATLPCISVRGSFQGLNLRDHMKITYGLLQGSPSICIYNLKGKNLVYFWNKVSFNCLVSYKCIFIYLDYVQIMIPKSSSQLSKMSVSNFSSDLMSLFLRFYRLYSRVGNLYWLSFVEVVW